MPVTAKQFVIRHTFTDVPSLEYGNPQNSRRENHFNVDWHISIYKASSGGSFLFLECPRYSDDYRVETAINTRIRKNNEENESIPKTFTFSPAHTYVTFPFTDNSVLNYLINGNLTVECHVTINKMTGIKESFSVLKKFDESNKEFSDVVLTVEGQKFYVGKLYIASHSTYFKALLLGNFEESKQSEVELIDIDPQDFQNYLELIHGVSLVEESTVAGILKLSDFFDSEIAIRRCEDFLLKSSQKTLKQKFELANKYKLDNLMEKCFSDIETPQDLQSVLPENIDSLDQKLSNKLLLKSISFHKQLDYYR